MKTSAGRRLSVAATIAVLAGASGIAAASGWAPFTRDDSATVFEGGQVSVLDSGATSVLANDFDFERDRMTAVLTKEPKEGVVDLDDDGTFVYTHGSGRKDDEFRYRAFDGTGFSRETRVRIEVEEAPNNPPFVTGTPPDQDAVEGRFFRMELAQYFGDLDDDDSLSYSLNGLPKRFRIDRDTGVLSGTPSASDARQTPYEVRVTATDEGGLSAFVEFSLTVRPDDRSDLEVTASVALNPVTVGASHDWRIEVRNLGPADLDDGELVMQWLTSGPGLSLAAPGNCTLQDNDSMEPSVRCDLAGLAAGSVLPFDVQGTMAADGENSLIAVALADDPVVDNNADVLGAQVVAAFSEGPTQLLSVDAADVDTADFDQDGFTDLVVAASETTVFMNSGNRTFTTPGTSLGAASGGAAVVALDWNGDGIEDIAVAGQAGRAARVYLGDGSGGFGNTVDIDAGEAGTVVAAAGGDFDQDGFDDLALTGTAGSVLVRSSSPTAFSRTALPAGAGLDVATGDFNNDTLTDLVIVEAAERQVRVLRNSGDGRHFSATSLQRGSVRSATAYDLNGDGNDDLLLAVDGNDLETPSSRLLIQQSDGSFPEGTSIGASPLNRMLSGDVDGDGLPDIVAVNSAGVHQLYMGQPSGAFVLADEQIVSDGMQKGTMVDFNSDQSLDLILAGRDSGFVELHANNGIGRLGLGDRIAPVVSIIGEATVTLPAGAEYADQGATATDDIDGDLSGAIETTGGVDTSVVGTYTVTYTAADRAGNKGSASRTVQVGVNQGTGGGGGGRVSPWFLFLESLLVAWFVLRRRTQRQV